MTATPFEPSPINTRRRMPVEERRRQIAGRAADLISRFGSYGVPMQAVADAAGLTLAGLNHHVKGRDELLALIVETYYDDFADDATMTARLRSLAVVPEQPGLLSLPRCLRGIVETNATRPELVALFVRLAAEAHDPEHPAHAYYEQRHPRLLGLFSSLPWHVPHRFRDPEVFADLLRTAFCAMDGAEVQALTDTDASLLVLWSRIERTLFSGPEWEGFR